jgi:lipopolysaccharide biosynthesis glycosyltransferase
MTTPTIKMKRLIYQVAVGKTSALYEHCIKSVASYAEKYGIEHIVQREPILRIKPNPFISNRSKEAVDRLGYLPIYEKENAFDYFDRYDQICIIDSDIFIKPNAPDIFVVVDPKVDFAGVVEREMPITPAYGNKIRNYSQMQYGPIASSSVPNSSSPLDFKKNSYGYEFFNMGMMFMNKSITQWFKPGETAKQFLDRPYWQPFIDGEGSWKWSTDQTLLNTWLKLTKMKVQHLDYRWNCLYSAVRSEKVPAAHFVHFFLKDKLPNKGENVKELMRSIS